jgi:hypothetical protein
MATEPIQLELKPDHCSSPEYLLVGKFQYGEGLMDHIDYEVIQGNTILTVFNHPTAQQVKIMLSGLTLDMLDPAKFDLLNPNTFTKLENMVDLDDFMEQKAQADVKAEMKAYPPLEGILLERVVMLRARAGDKDALARLYMSHLKEIRARVPLAALESPIGPDLFQEQYFDFCNTLKRINIKEGEKFPKINTVMHKHLGHQITRNINKLSNSMGVSENVSRMFKTVSEMTPELIHELYCNPQALSQYLSENPQMEKKFLRKCCFFICAPFSKC